MNDVAKVQIKTGKTHLGDKFFPELWTNKPHQKTFTLLFTQKKQHYFVNHK